MRLTDFVWAEKYRPTTIDECVLPANLKAKVGGFIEEGEIPNLLLSGKSGVGKTTIARALADALGYEYIIINGSLNGGIDTLRNTISDYASTMSLSGKRKLVILDEADHLSAAMQPALRNFMESFSSSCSFILTCNFKNKIIDPLQSRCAVIDFVVDASEKKALIIQMISAIEAILKAEQIEYNKKVLSHVVVKYFPDMRKMLNELQSYAAKGTIDEGILTLSNRTYNNLIKSLSEKNFQEVRQWVAETMQGDCTTIYRDLYDHLLPVVSKDVIPQMVVIIANYQFKHQFVADQEINLVAALVEIMTSCF